MEKFQLGVLLVHGIGTQPPRDTLVRWGDALLNVIRRATMTQSLEDRAQVVLTHHGPGSINIVAVLPKFNGPCLRLVKRPLPNARSSRYDLVSQGWGGNEAAGHCR